MTNLNDSGFGSLRQALAAANATADAGTITFQSGLAGTILLTSGQLEVSNTLTIQGPGADVLTVGRRPARALRCY